MLLYYYCKVIDECSIITIDGSLIDYIDKPDVYKPEGVEITLFSEFNYDDEGEIEIIIPKLGSNIFFSGDYRTKEEIENVIQENKDGQ